MIDSAGLVNNLYGDILANEFGPLKLKAIRQSLIDRQLCRVEINKRIGRVKRIFKWAVGQKIP